MLLTEETTLITADEYYKAGALDQAAELYRQMLDRSAARAKAWYRLAEIAWQQHRPQEAEDNLKKCLTVDPNYVPALKILGGILSQQGKYSEAILLFRRLQELNPADPESQINLAALLGHLKQYQAAEQLLLALLENRPEYARAYYNLGITYAKQGRLLEAIKSYRRSIQLQPDHAPTHYNLGKIYQFQRNFAGAVTAFKATIALESRHLGAHFDLGIVYWQQNQLDKTLRCFERVLELNPEHIDTLFNQANIYTSQGLMTEASRCCQRILQIEPSHWPALAKLAAASVSLEEFATAEKYFRRAINLQPDRAELYHGLGVVLYRQGALEPAMANYQRALSLDPTKILWQLEASFINPELMPDKQAINRWRLYLQAVLDHYRGQKIDLTPLLPQLSACNVHPPLEILYHGCNNRPFKVQFANMFQVKTASNSTSSFLPGTSQKERYRLGFLVTKGHEQVFNHFIAGVLNHLNHDKFETVVLCDQAHHSLIQLTHPAVGFLTFTANVPDAIQKIRDAAFDLIYYWEVGTDSMNYFLPFFRLAPVQCTSWGTPETTGIETVDYFISSQLFEPANGDAHYSETLIKLSSLGMYFFRPDKTRLSLDRASVGLSAEDHVYYCTQHLQKFHPEFDELLAQILQRDSRAIILIKAKSNHLNNALRQRWQQRMPAMLDRIKFVPYQDYTDYLSLIKAADVLLDTLHYSGGTTSFEGIAVGTPIVTWPGQFMRGRMTYGCYQRIGVLDTVVWSAEEYVSKAIQLATNRTYQAEIRTKILAANHHLFEDMRAVHELEQFFEWAIEKSRQERTRDW